MFSNFMTWFSTADWDAVFDYVAVAVLARYIPSFTPIYESIKDLINKATK